jgi:hypothetical protein
MAFNFNLMICLFICHRHSKKWTPFKAYKAKTAFVNPIKFQITNTLFQITLHCCQVPSRATAIFSDNGLGRYQGSLLIKPFNSCTTENCYLADSFLRLLTYYMAVNMNKLEISEWDFRLSWWQVWRWLSSGMLCHVVLLQACCLHHQARIMEAVSSSETSVNTYQTTWCNIPEEVIFIH